MEIEIISKENIGPASPTPPHLNTHKLSILDQIFLPFYVPLVLFYLNDQNTSLNDVIFTRAKHLKQSLSETLTRFYPFAGRIKDDLYIDCNDEGVYYEEARVNYRLSKLLGQVDHQLINQLVPKDPNSMESTSGKYVLVIQVNIFDCGGIAIGSRTSHKIIDAQSYTTFMKAWAAEARGSSVIIEPSFIAPYLFPQKPSALYKWPPVNKQGKFTTMRFVFHAAALAALKAKVASSSTSIVKCPTSFEVVSALIWKCAAKAALKARSNSENTPSILSIFVDLRRRKLPPLSNHSIGNLLWRPFAQCTPTTTDVQELHHMVDQIREVIGKIDNDFIDKMKGNENFSCVSQCLKEYCELHPRVDCLNVTSMCNIGVYDADFGWGKPVWFFYSCTTPVVVLVDTRSGDGIEAFVTLREQDMAMFKHDVDVQAFSSLNPSPLELCNLAACARL